MHRNHSIDIMKLIFSIVMIIYHYNYIYLEWKSKYLFKGGYILVDAFFVISGFFLHKSLIKNPDIKIVDYMKHRYKTVYLQYFIAFIGAIGTFFFVENIETLNINIVKKVVLEALILQEWPFFRFEAFNGIAWYVSKMLFVTLLIVIAERVLGKMTTKILLSVAVVGCLLYMFLVFGNLHPHTFTRSIAGMGIGYLCDGIVSNKGVKKLKWSNSLFVLGFCICILFAEVCKDNILDFFIYIPIVMALMGSNNSFFVATENQLYCQI